MNNENEKLDVLLGKDMPTVLQTGALDTHWSVVSQGSENNLLTAAASAGRNYKWPNYEL